MSMKKAILIFILLIIAAGVVLYFGWVNVKPGFFGIAHSTITGTIEYPLESGKIHWFWQKLIPKSFHLYMVERDPVFLSFKTTYSLPGSEQLEEFGRFDLTVQTNIQYSIEYDAARKLIDSSIFTEFDDYFVGLVSSRVDEAVEEFVFENMIRYTKYDEAISYSMLSVLEENIERRIGNSIRAYKLEDASWSITYTEVPQIELYNDALNRYFSHLENVYRFKEDELDRESVYLARMKENDLEIDRWEKYGELIKKYPELLKYFYIEKFSGQADVLVLPQNETTGFPKMLEPREFPPREPPQTMEKPAPSVQQEEEVPAPRHTEETEEEAEQPDTAEREFTQGDSASEDGRKWHEKLMFWKYIDKQDGE
jgi:hypothetical protein